MEWRSELNAEQGIREWGRMRISICIPTYNRPERLADCLASLIKERREGDVDFEVCVSDNGSSAETGQVVRAAQAQMPIKYHRNGSNLGIPRNFLKVVSMASGEFAWLLGDDDLLMPGAIAHIDQLIQAHPGVDLFYVNANHLNTEFVDRHDRPFDTAKLPSKMKPFSPWTRSGELPYFDLVDPRISFDFMGGMFLSVFRRELWMRNADALDATAIVDSRVFSHFDNTFPHLKIFARSFARSTAYFEPRPQSVCLTGAREWSPKYQLVHAIRLVEGLEEFRANGLPLWRYLWCRNAALANFIPELGFMYLNRKTSGWEYINPFTALVKNALFPNVYLSPFRFLHRRFMTHLRGRQRGEG